MENTSNKWNHLPRDMYYYRQRYKNALFSKLQRFFIDESERMGITKKDIADRLRRDPAQITRWLSSPSNLTIETLSDILFAMESEPEPPVIVRFVDRKAANYTHPLISRVLGAEEKPQKAQQSHVAVRVKSTSEALKMHTYQTPTLDGAEL